jgi:uncharacterized membrane protein
MSAQLPAFAKALKRRHQLFQNQKVSRRVRAQWTDENDPPVLNDLPSDASPPRKSLRSRRVRALEKDEIRAPAAAKRHSNDLTEDTDCSDPGGLSAIEPLDDVSSLRTENAELLRRLRALKHENRELLQGRTNLRNELAALKSKGADYLSVSKKLISCEQETETVRKLIETNTAQIVELDYAYNSLENDYKRHLDLQKLDPESTALQQLEINRLTRDIEHLRSGWKPDEVGTRNRFHTAPDDPLMDFRRSIPRSTQTIPSAMKDNLRFGHDSFHSRPNADIPVAKLTDVQLREQVQFLTEEKAEKERLLNRAPPKGANRAHVRAQKAELDDEITALSACFSKVRLEMKRRGLY